MLRFLQPRRTILSSMCELHVQFKRWWMVMTNDEQRDVLIRGGMIAVCAVAATVTLPAIGSLQAERRADAEYAALAQRLATFVDGGDAVRTAAHTPALIASPWLRNVEYSLKRDIDSSMSRYAMRDRDGAALASLVSFRPEHIERAETIDAETMCMAQAVYYESAREPLDGQIAVAEVIANRMRDHRYPDTACGVVYQGATRTTGCQFTFTCDGALSVAPSGENWERAQRVAAHVLMKLHEERTGGATHYHATYVDPIWNAGLIKTDKIGLHIFYRFPRGTEWASVEQNFASRKAQSAVQLAALDAEAAELAAMDEELLFAEATDAAPPAEEGYYTVAPAAVSTSTRTITSSAPRYTTIRTVTETPEPEAHESIAAYTARQTGGAAVMAVSSAGALR